MCVCCMYIARKYRITNNGNTNSNSKLVTEFMILGLQSEPLNHFDYDGTKHN